MTRPLDHGTLNLGGLNRGRAKLRAQALAVMAGILALIACLDAGAQPYFSGAYTSTHQGVVFQWGAPGDRPVPADYDGDGRADFAVFRPYEGAEEGIWYIKRSSDGGVVRQQWGSATLGDVTVPADYDGDGKADVAVWRPADGAWYILRSSDGQVIYRQLGRSGDVPVPADYDGDGRADPAVYSAGTWTIVASTRGPIVAQLGDAADVPVPADYDGDGRADLAVYRPATGQWRVRDSSLDVVRSVHVGQAGDVPVPADYDGDGRTDFAAWRRTGAWFIVTQAGGVQIEIWGGSGDVPVPMDYDGDRRADRFVYRP